MFFRVTGTHAIYLTGNYLIPADDQQTGPYDESDDEEDMYGDYDLPPDEDELDELEDDESDELDDIDDPRITELDDDEAPKLVKKEAAKGSKSKKRAAESEEDSNLDDLMAQTLQPADVATNGDAKLSKKAQKKLKKNNGEASAVAPQAEAVKKSDPATKESPGKKVQFAKVLEKGPSGTAEKTTKAETPSNDGKPKPTLGVKKVQGVTVDDKKLGSGPVAKKGDRVEMRYIGKLKDGKVFDCKYLPDFKTHPCTDSTNSEQEGQAICFQSWYWRRYQRVGFGHSRHVGRRRA